MNASDSNNLAVTPTKKELPLMVVFVRHAQAGGASVNDQIGPPLTAIGLQQAELVAQRLSGESFRHIYSSDFARAFDTAKAVLRFHGGTPYTVNTDIREIHHFHFIKETEKLKSEMRRVVEDEADAVLRFAKHLRAEHHVGEKILVVSHGNFIRTILPVLGNRNPKESVLLDIGNTAVTAIDLWPSGEAVLRLANCTRHLPPNLLT